MQTSWRNNSPTRTPITVRTYKRERGAVRRLRLDVVDAEYRQGLVSCPAERDRDIARSVRMAGGAVWPRSKHAIAGIAPDQEPSANRIAELSDLAKRDRVTTIFTETLVSPKVAETLACEAGGLKTKTLNPLEGSDREPAEAGCRLRVGHARQPAVAARRARVLVIYGRARKHGRGRRGRRRGRTRRSRAAAARLRHLRIQVGDPLQRRGIDAFDAV